MSVRTCHDISVYANHGTYLGTDVSNHSSLIANDGDLSAIFNGGTYVDASAVVSVTPPYGFTFGCWFFAYSNYTKESYGAGVLSFNTKPGGDGPWGGQSNRMMVRFGGRSQPWTPYLDLGDGSIYLATPPVNPEDPHFLAVSVRETYVELFLDGASFGTHAIVSGHHLQPDDRFSMAQEYDDNTATDFFEGVLDEVFVSPNLSHAQIQRLYDIGRGALTDNTYLAEMLGCEPYGYWRMNDALSGWRVGAVAIG